MLPTAYAQTTYETEAGGQLDLIVQYAPKNYQAGFSFYSAAWPLMGDYPKAHNGVQTGLYGTWLGAEKSFDNDHYTTIEGGLGWWRDHNFQTATPKYSMGGVAIGNESWWFANGPGNGSDGGNGRYGVAQLSSSLLFPPDGLNLRQGTSGEIFGYGYLPLPLTEPKTMTAGAPVLTGNHSWTLFINTGNFKGPVGFFTPYFWSQVAVLNPQWSGETFDTCWGQANHTYAMETQGILRGVAYDEGDTTFIRTMPVYYPVDSSGYSQLVHRICVYDQDALWNDVEQWLNSNGSAPSGAIKSASTFSESSIPATPEWQIRRNQTSMGHLDWRGVVSPFAPNAQESGYKWRTDLLTVIPTANGSLVKLPEYYKGTSAPNPSSRWEPINKADMPASAVSALAGAEFNHPVSHDSLVPYESNDPVWTSPGPVSGPSLALLGDGSYVTYYWYRFADQPTLQKADMSMAERNRIQIVCEKIHREWKNDRDYIAPATSGRLAELDPGVLVTPPAGLEYGYVPIAWRQDWGGSVASPGSLKFTSVPATQEAGNSFSVTVRAVDTSGVAQNVTEATLVKLSVASGSGILSGTTFGTIASGSSSVTISGVRYSAADIMTLTAAATCLSPGTSAPITGPVDLKGLPVSSGLVLRMDASQISATASGTQLNTWTDTSRKANHAVRQSQSSSGYPRYVTNAVNGLPVVRFNSSNSNSGDSLNFRKLSTIRSVFWVLKENAGLADNHFLLGGSDTYDFHRGSSPNGPLWNTSDTAASIRNGVTKLMGNSVDGTTTSLPSESFQVVSLVTTGNVSADQICQDRTYHGSWQGDIAEILIYDRALSSEEENQVGSYLGSKYGLVTAYDTLPVAHGLVLRMDASKITGTADGAQLNSWKDTSRAGNNAIRQSGSSTGFPKYVANAVNGRPVVRFSSSSNSTGDYLKFDRISTIQTVFWVLKENAGLADSHFLLGDSRLYDFHRGLSANGTLWDVNYTSASIRDGATKLMGNAINGTTTALPSGNFQLISLVTAGNVSADQLCQDRAYHGSWQGDIAEILIYNRTLTQAEEAQVGSYLSNKYGLATRYPPVVTPTPRMSFAAWASDTAQGLTAGVNNGPMDDPDRDGISNLLEFTLAGKPMEPLRTILPNLIKDGSGWCLEYARSDDSQASITQVVEYSSDLKTWSPITVPSAAAPGIVITGGSPSDWIKVTIPAGVGLPTFARLKVTQQPLPTGN